MSKFVIQPDGIYFVEDHRAALIEGASIIDDGKGNLSVAVDPSRFERAVIGRVYTDAVGFSVQSGKQMMTLADATVVAVEDVAVATKDVPLDQPVKASDYVAKKVG